MPSLNYLLRNFDEAHRTAFKIARKYFRRKYVTGISIGEAFRNGKSDGIAICVHVKKKHPEKLLRKSQIFPREINKIRVDVIESNLREICISQNELNKRNYKTSDPLVPGVAITSTAKTAGTIGMFVQDQRDNGEACILTCAHVLDASNGSNVFHPVGQQKEPIGVIKRVLRDYYCDAAIVTLDKSRAFSNTPFGMQERINGFRDPKSGDILYKSGRSTGVTSAKVVSVGEQIIRISKGELKMWGIMLIPTLDHDTDEISEEGDSGSIWFDSSTGEGVGLTVAGDYLGAANIKEWAFACLLSLVVEKLRINI